MRVAVIGGGLGGLAAAALAARAGHRVKLFEKSSSVGGRAATHASQGYFLNLGAHALYRGGAAERALADLGVAFAGKSPELGGYAIAGDTLRTLPVGFVSILSTSLLTLGAKVEVAKLLARVGGFDPTEVENESVERWIEQNVTREDARAFMRATMRLTTYSADLGRYSAGVAIGLLQAVLRTGVIYLDGGWSTLVRGLHEAGEASGVDVVTGERIVAIESEDGRVARVRLASGPAFPVDAAIVVGSPASASSLVPESPTLARAARESVPGIAACLDVALSRLPVRRATFALGIDRPLYFSVHSFAARLAPDGGAVIHTAVYRSDDSVTTSAELEAELESTIDRLQPGWRELVVERRFMPKLTVTNAIPLASLGGYAGRIDPRVPEIAGLFVAGDWVGKTGCLADATLGSAREAVDLLGAYAATVPRRRAHDVAVA